MHIQINKITWTASQQEIQESYKLVGLALVHTFCDLIMFLTFFVWLMRLIWIPKEISGGKGPNFDFPFQAVYGTG